MLVDVVQESSPEFRTGSGIVGTDVLGLGAASARQTVMLYVGGGAADQGYSRIAR
jgi:hypothetical protein